MGYLPLARLVLLGYLGLASVICIAGTAHGIAAGGRIPTALTATSGTLTSDIVISTPGKVASGNAVTVNLIGLQHDWAGDLVITLSYIPAQGSPVTVDLIDRIGQDVSHASCAASRIGA